MALLDRRLAVQQINVERDEEEAWATTHLDSTKRAAQIGKQVARNTALGLAFRVPGLVVGVTSHLGRKASAAVQGYRASTCGASCRVTAVRVERLFRINAWDGHRPMSPYVEVRVTVGGRILTDSVYRGRTAALYRAGETCVFPEGKHSTVVGLPAEAGDAVLVVRVLDEPEVRAVGAARRLSAAGAGTADPFLVGTAAAALGPLLERPGAAVEVNLGLCRGPDFDKDAGLVRLRIQVVPKDTLSPPDDDDTNDDTAAAASREPDSLRPLPEPRQ